MPIVLHGLKTRVVKANDDIIEVILEALQQNDLKLQDGDILVISSKIVSICENRLVDLEKISPTEKAIKLAKVTGSTPQFVELVLEEADKIYGGVYGALLTLKDNILQANAGIDVSNVPRGYAILLPSNPAKTAFEIRKKLKEKIGKKIGIIIVDSRTQPLRLGNIGLAIGVAGFYPVVDERGHEDIFGYPLKFTRRALADNLSCAANFIMGETDEKIPIVLIQGAQVEMTEEFISSDLMFISPEECMYIGALREKLSPI